MKEIDWKLGVCGRYDYARIGSITLYCNRTFTNTSGCRWRATVRIHLRGHEMKRGKLRHSISKAREDAVELAREMLLDFHVGLMAEMDNFDLDGSRCDAKD